MIKFDSLEVAGLEPALRGMRNPYNSWEASDTLFWHDEMQIGKNDLDLALRLVKAGKSHSKFRRMIAVWVDITAPLYWWKQFDTYKAGTVSNSCSTMHKIHAEEFKIDDFSLDSIGDNSRHFSAFCSVVDALNEARSAFLKTKDKGDWYTMVALLPSSYNQRRTIMLNYEVLANIYSTRKEHKLNEWRAFCEWIEGLPLSEIITQKETCGSGCKCGKK